MSSIVPFIAVLISLAISEASADSLKLYAIDPPMPIDWSSPASLSLTTAKNSIGKDYAPIGHFAVEIECSRPNRYGKRHVLTGVERKNPAESRKITLKKKLGLGSLIYTFDGRLQDAIRLREEIAMARKDRRLQVIEVLTSAARCESMMTFLENWIDAGSYQIYGGGKETALGEGAGCADFAMEFLKIATARPIESSWMVRLSLPAKLVGDGGEKKVPFRRLLTRFDWARADEESIRFEIMDTSLVPEWIRKRGGSEKNPYLWSAHVFPSGLILPPGVDLRKAVEEAVAQLPASPRPTFRYRYDTSLPAATLWDSIDLGM